MKGSPRALRFLQAVQAPLEIHEHCKQICLYSLSVPHQPETLFLLLHQFDCQLLPACFHCYLNAGL